MKSIQNFAITQSKPGIYLLGNIPSDKHNCFIASLFPNKSPPILSGNGPIFIMV